jgi:hypothetical protein
VLLAAFFGFLKLLPMLLSWLPNFQSSTVTVGSYYSIALNAIDSTGDALLDVDIVYRR